MTKRWGRETWGQRVRQALLWILVVVLVSPVVLLVIYRELDPPITPLMLIRLAEGEAGAVVALDEEPEAAQGPGQIGHLLEGRRAVAEPHPGQIAQRTKSRIHEYFPLGPNADTDADIQHLAAKK